MKKDERTRITITCSKKFKHEMENKAHSFNMSLAEFARLSMVDLNIDYYDGLLDMIPLIYDQGAALYKIAYESDASTYCAKDIKDCIEPHTLLFHSVRAKLEEQSKGVNFYANNYTKRK